MNNKQQSHAKIDLRASSLKSRIRLRNRKRARTTMQETNRTHRATRIVNELKNRVTRIESYKAIKSRKLVA